MTSPFDRLVEDIVRETAARNPAWATTEGIRGHDDALADPTPAAFEADAERLRARLADLARAEGGSAVDRDALAFALELDLFNVETLRAWEKNPDLATEFMDHLFPLLIRTERPIEERAVAMAARLEKARAFLEAGRPRVDAAKAPRLWVDVALESADQAPAFLEAVVAAARAASPATRERVERAAREAGLALAEHRAWLARELAPRATGDWAIGADAFEALLAKRLLPFTADELWKLGHELVARERAEMREAALTVLASRGKEMSGDVAKEALALVRLDHPSTFAGVLEEYRSAIEEARKYVVAHGVAGVPERAPLDVIETPSYLRHLMPFAAYVQPARFDKDSRGTYLVTPKADLSAFMRADIRNTTVHEAYPGHHLQLALAREHPSLARFLVSAPEMVEGWALYCEAVMGRHGFTAAPAERFVRAKDALWRAVRIVLDVGLHTGRVSYAEAVAMLMDEAGMSREEAEAEAKRYTLSPAYNLSYLIGRLGFERLRAKREREPGWSERAFHDALLNQGSLPLPLLERAAFGT